MKSSQTDVSQFQALFENAAEGILITTDSGEIELANPAALAMFGYSIADISGQKIEILVPQNLRGGHSRHRENFQRDPHARSMGLGMELHGQRKDGSVFPVEISLSPYQTEEGRFIIVFAIDITVRQQLAAQREEMAVALEREKEMGDLKTRFVSIASHEFRTPLSAILSSASLINSYADRGDLVSIKKHTARIKNSVAHLQNILTEFLSLGKIEDGKVEAKMEEINFPEMVQELEEDMKPLLKKGQTLSCRRSGADMVFLDKNLFRIVAINLISNAIKFSPENSEIEVSCHAEGGHADFRVRDRGIGISEADQQKLFERFFRADNASNVPGTGLGLYIVKRYVELMGGVIFFRSQIGEGSEFRVQF